MSELDEQMILLSKIFTDVHCLTCGEQNVLTVKGTNIIRPLRAEFKTTPNIQVKGGTQDPLHQREVSEPNSSQGTVG